VQGVNLAVIPLSAIERVEVLKDGASAIYGSDAIGGVINFILRQDYKGAEASVFYGAPTRSGGGAQTTLTGAVGFGDLAKDRYNFVISASYNDQKNLDQRDRNFSNTSYRPDIGLNALSSNSFPARITTGGIGVPGTPDHCAPSTFFADLGGCYYDPSSQKGVEMIPDDKLLNIFASGKYQFNRDWQGYATALYAHDETRYRIQPVPLSSIFPYGPTLNIPGNITLMPSSPFYPHDLAQQAGVDGQPLDIRYRAIENGLRDTTDTNENWQMVAGVKGAWKDWDWDGSFFYSEGQTKQKLNGGFPDLTQLYPLLNSGTVNFFGPNTPDITSQLVATNFNGQTFSGTSKNYGVQGKTSGDIWQLPAGPLALAVGAEVRREQLTQNAAPILATGTIAGYGGNVLDVAGSRNIYAAFGELNVPIVKTLEGTAALRYDHYSDFGSTTNPKFSLRWQPTRSLLLRGSYGTGFLAPSLYQLFTPPIGGVTQPGLTDPIRCPVTHDTALDCSTQFNVLFGGTAALKPEQSEQTTAGFVIEPIPNASFSIDYFKINLKNAIVDGIPPLTILGDLGEFGSLVTRAPSEPGSTLPGHITSILQTFINVGAERLQGLDIEGHYRAPMKRWGRLSFNLAGTYYLRYDTQNPGGSYTGSVGTTFGTVSTGVIPRWRHYASATWDQAPWSATLAQTYQTSYTDQQTDFNGNLRAVGSLSLWDLQGSYSGFRNWKLALGVKNLFDRDPPVSSNLSTFISGLDPSYYDPRARFVYTTVTYKFK
jgi:iron complex outermembrane receptor protein